MFTLKITFMRKTFLISLILILGKATLFAQDTLNNRCWTQEMDTTEFQNQPWYSNNDYIENFLDSIGYPLKGSLCEKKLTLNH